MVLLLLLLLGFQIYSLSIQSVQLLPPELTRAMELQKKLDSVISNQRPNHDKSFKYNPNYLTDFQANLIGLSTQAYDRLKRYRQANMFINNSKDFQLITQLSDAQFKPIEK